MIDTINYYNKNSKEYFSQTVNADMSYNYNRFIKYLTNGSKVLDFGCGSGRDVKYFMDNGFDAYGIDGSENMCELAREYTHNSNIRYMNFLDYNEKDIYNGIWACASLLHLNEEELSTVFYKMIDACADDAVIYASFKYGDFIGMRDNRFYIDMNEERILHFIFIYNELSIEDMWISSDVLLNRGEQKWMNVILRVRKL